MVNRPVEVKKIFLQAIELDDPQQRQAFLRQACGDDRQLRERVEQLVAAHLEPDSCFGSSTAEEAADEATAVAGGQPPTAAAASQLLEFLQPCSAPHRLGLLGDYEIMEVIGQGGMGVVLKAYDTKLERVVAIKCLSPALAFNATAVKRFLREARAAAAVSHDHVVTIFAVEEATAPPFIVMECVAGQSLQQKIDRTGLLSTEEILRIGMQISDGLAAAHRQGLVHRDIKPSNVLLENGVERVKITDFGLARAVDDVTMTQTGHVAGTPEYMSPEQAHGEHLDVRSDLFSLGSVMYTMCTGRPAFRAGSTPAVLHRVCHDTPRAIAEVNPTVPDALIAVIERLMAKDPARRFQSAAEVAQLLADMLAQYQRSEGRILPVVQARAVAGPSRHLGLQAALLAMVLLAGGLAAWSMLSPVRSLWRKFTGWQGPQQTMPMVIPDRQLAIETGPPPADVPFDPQQASSFQDTWAEHLRVPVDYQDSLGIQYRLIPAGRFPMGNDLAEVHAQVRELELNEAGEFELFTARSSAPRHLVTLSRPYYLSSCEITVAQFRAFTDTTGYRSTLTSIKSPAFVWSELIDEADSDADRRPVLGVSWEDARAFCRWLSERNGLACDLPSEAQWEFACRAGSATRWSFGDDATQLLEYANCGLGKDPLPATVGGRRANAFGLFDMHGNVDEWCLDWHMRDFYSRPPAHDPVCLEAALDPGSGRVVRGGSWLYPRLWSQSASRTYDFPAQPVRKHGFRVAITSGLERLRVPDESAEEATEEVAEEAIAESPGE